MPMEEAIGQGYISPQILSLQRCSQGRQEGGDKLPWAPTLIGSQLESKCLKLSRFFKLVRAFLELRAPYCSSTCSVAKVYFRDPQRRFKLREAPDRPSNILVANAEPSNWQNNKHHVCVHIQGIHFALSLGKKDPLPTVL